MPTDPDTSAEAIERLCEWLDARKVLWATTELEPVSAVLKALQAKLAEAEMKAEEQYKVDSEIIAHVKQQNAALVEALHRCRERFKEYAILHRVKKTTDGYEKAERNDAMVAVCDEALVKAGEAV